MGSDLLAEASHHGAVHPHAKSLIPSTKKRNKHLVSFKLMLDMFKILVNKLHL